MESLRPLQRLFRILKKDRKDIYKVYVYAFLNGLVNLSLPLGIQAIINLIQGAEVSTSWIVLVVFVTIGVSTTGVFQLLQLRIVENISQRIFSRASFEFAYRIPRIKTRNLYNYYAPELANRFFDTLTIQKGLSKILIDFSLASFQILAGLVVLSMYHPFFILFGVALVALIYIIVAFSGPRGIATSLVESKFKYKVAHWLEEIARTKLSFKLIADPEISLSNTDERVSGYINARERHFKVLVGQFYSLIAFKVLITAGLLLIGGMLVFNQEMNIGQFVAAEIIILLIISSVEKLIISLDSIYDVLTALEKIGYVTDMPLDNEEGFSFDDDTSGIGTTMSDVAFGFPDNPKPILHDIDIDIPPGTSVWITGPSGSGKSTLMALWSGLHDPDQGVVKFNGFSLKTLNLKSLRRKVGYALSNNQIFQGSIIDNITMGDDTISLADVIKAVSLVRLDDFVTSKQEGLQTMLDPDGSRIPRSISNKIILARSIVHKPILLMLEDPLDHVLAEEKELIIKNLTAPEHPWSIIVTSVDTLWSKYIKNKIVVENGFVKQHKVN